MEFSNVWINEDGFVKVYVDPKIPNNISFIVKPVQISGLLLQWHYNEAVDLNSRPSLVLISLSNNTIYVKHKDRRYRSTSALNQNDYNDVVIELVEGSADVSVSINGEPKESMEEIQEDLETASTFNPEQTKAQFGQTLIMKIGGARFIGGIQDILINNE